MTTETGNTKTGQTIREIYADWESLTFEQKKAVFAERRPKAEKLLRGLLKPGDKMRATKASCNAREATFTFHGWDGGWIISKSGESISPCMVYSVNRQIINA
ncbi:hypothetical protein ETW23_03785 [Leisingera sp. NJS201]|uniref:hypothetical protein n=1 Tax=Leisingera sp. NJS201 TaxID=2508306 RepID=UPI001070A04D|nr:hypothetical protein [Leisingera sp. NJS201]QBR35387.1 hypothetical protein ETW23_03785 [Leisingera sp. NJS201]